MTVRLTRRGLLLGSLAYAAWTGTRGAFAQSPSAPSTTTLADLRRAEDAAIREVVRTLRPKPGVYRMLDARGDVLYVGKARALKNRVANYCQVANLSGRLQRMVSQTRGMEIVTTNSEAEALLLEAQLIKRFRPPYNVLLRDDKSFPFILLRAEHDFPRIMKHRGARKAKGDYYGPFASAGSVNTTINALQKLFLLRICTSIFFCTAPDLPPRKSFASRTSSA